MKVIVFGASGRVGRMVVAEALRRGYEVTAFIHSHSIEPTDGLTNIQGDIYDRPSVEAALAGHDVILCTLSSWHARDKNVLSTAMQRIIPAAEALGICRLVSVTGWAQAPGARDPLRARLGRVLMNTIAPKILRDSGDHIALLAHSSLNWTVIRSSLMTGNHDDAYKLDRKSGSLTITRRAIAAAILDLVETNEWPKTAPFIRQG